MVAVIINTSSAFYVYFIMPHPYPEATHRRIYRLARYGYKKRMSNDDRSQTITHSPLSSAVWTGLEPATPCVTGRYSNQLNYHTKVCLRGSTKGLPSVLQCKVSNYSNTMQIFLKKFFVDLGE